MVFQFAPIANAAFAPVMAFLGSERRILRGIMPDHVMDFPGQNFFTGDALRAVTIFVIQPLELPMLHLDTGNPGLAALGAGGGIITPDGMHRREYFLTAFGAYLKAASPRGSLDIRPIMVAAEAGEVHISGMAVTAAAGVIAGAFMPAAGAFVCNAAFIACLPVLVIVSLPGEPGVADVFNGYARFLTNTAGEFICAGGGMRRAFGDIAAQIAQLPVFRIVGTPFQPLAVVKHAAVEIFSAANSANGGVFAAVGVGFVSTLIRPGIPFRRFAAEAAFQPVQSAVMRIDPITVMLDIAIGRAVVFTADSAKVSVAAVNGMFFIIIVLAAA